MKEEVGKEDEREEKGLLADSAPDSWSVFECGCCQVPLFAVQRDSESTAIGVGVASVAGVAGVASEVAAAVPVLFPSPGAWDWRVDAFFQR